MQNEPSPSPKSVELPVDAMVIKLIFVVQIFGEAPEPVAKIPLVESENPAPILRAVFKSPKSFPPPPDEIVT